MTEVYEIDLNKKYIIQFENRISAADFERIKRMIDKWIISDNPFLVLDYTVKLKKISELEGLECE